MLLGPRGRNEYELAPRASDADTKRELPHLVGGRSVRQAVHVVRLREGDYWVPDGNCFV